MKCSRLHFLQKAIEPTEASAPHGIQFFIYLVSGKPSTKLKSRTI